MLRYVNRTKEVYLKLKGCPAQREVYDALDFHKSLETNISNPFTNSQLADLSGTSRQRISGVLDSLMKKGLIQRVTTPKKYVFQYLLVEQQQSEVVKFPNGSAEVKADQEQFLREMGDL